MQWFLIVIIAVAFLLLTVVGVYFIVKFQHPDDKNEAWAPKLVVLFGFIMAGATVLLLPLDVANDGTFPGTSLRKSVILVVLMCFFLWVMKYHTFYIVNMSPLIQKYVISCFHLLLLNRL